MTSRTRWPLLNRVAVSDVYDACVRWLQVGVASLRWKMMESSSTMMPLVASEAFGQVEQLTRRLASILQQYPEGPGCVLCPFLLLRYMCRLSHPFRALVMCLG